MKKEHPMHRFIMSIIALIIANAFTACNERNSDTDPFRKQSYDLKNDMADSVKSLETVNNEEYYVHSFIAAAGDSTVILYQPIKLSIKLHSERPGNNQNIFLCVPAAYTTPSNTIDGLFYIEGKEISGIVNNLLTGGCIISEDSIIILSKNQINSALLREIRLEKRSFFQQTLLVMNSRIVPCSLFGKKENVRRALVQFEDKICISETKKPMTIIQFQQSLIKLKAINAIYLDMGTWSEGWYRGENREKIVIGENMINTNRQTNWLTFEK